MTQKTSIDKIKCPKCGHVLPLTETLSKSAEAKIRKELETEANQEKQKLALKEKELLQKMQKLEKSEKEIDKKVLEKLESEKAKMWQTALKKAEEKQAVELKDLKEEVKEKEDKLEQARKSELDLRKQKRELEDQKKNFEIEIEKKLDKERDEIAAKAKKSAKEETNDMLMQKEKQIKMMQKTIADLKQKSEQGSQQIQGEVQEEDLKQILQSSFASDFIEDVPTGIKGADLIQLVRTEFGSKSGVILWESKNTKTWSDSWIKKLKQDQGLAKADVSILISKALPEALDNFGQIKGVWVASRAFAVPLAHIIRRHLIEIAGVKQSIKNRGGKIEQLYNYISGIQFKNHIENMVLAFVSMQQDLETEKRSTQRLWSKREKEIERVISNISGIYGDMQGIVGASSLPQIKSLEMPMLEQGKSSQK